VNESVTQNKLKALQIAIFNRCSPVQGHPGSKFIMPVESPLLVFYLTSIAPNIVSLTAFEIFDAKIL